MYIMMAGRTEDRIRIRPKSADPELQFEKRNTFRVSRAVRCGHDDGGEGLKSGSDIFSKTGSGSEQNPPIKNCGLKTEIPFGFPVQPEVYMKMAGED